MTLLRSGLATHIRAILGAKFGPYETSKGDPLELLNNNLDCAGFCTVLLALQNGVKACSVVPGAGLGYTSPNDFLYVRYLGCAENRSNDIQLVSRGQWVFNLDLGQDCWLGLYSQGVRVGTLDAHLGYAMEAFNEELEVSDDESVNLWRVYGQRWCVYREGKEDPERGVTFNPRSGGGGPLEKRVLLTEDRSKPKPMNRAARRKAARTKS